MISTSTRVERLVLSLFPNKEGIRPHTHLVDDLGATWEDYARLAHHLRSEFGGDEPTQLQLESFARVRDLVRWADRRTRR